MAKKLYGTDPDQVPTNADLGTMAYQDSKNTVLENAYINAKGADGLEMGRDYTSPNNSSRLFFNSNVSGGNWTIFNNSGTLKMQSGAEAGSTSGNYTAFTLTTTNAVFGANAVFSSGYGIDFSATGNSSGTTSSELLDDYEEGTFTPAFTYSISTTGLSISYANQTGYYTKIGNIVYYTCDLRITSFTKGSASGTLQLEGFPFASKNQSNYARPNTVPNLYQWPYQTNAGYQPMFGMFQDGVTKGDFSMMRSNNSSTAVTDPDGDSMLFLTGWYYAA